MNSEILTSAGWIKRTRQLLDSWEYWFATPLIARTSPQQDSIQIADASFVVVAHDGERDPLLNFANRVALQLWEMPLQDFLGTPSRHTAEPVHRAERAQLLARTTRDGFIEDYSGIRIAASGQRFRIRRAVVWNVLDTDGSPAGQAATFSEWTMLEDESSS